MEFFNIFLEQSDNNFSLSPVKQFGFEIDEFSRVYGRIIMTGHIVYKPEKNYRSKKQFEEFKEKNMVDIPAVFMLFEEENHVISEMQNINNLFINKFDEIKEKYMNNNSMIMFGYVKPAKMRKNGKPGRAFKVHRQNRFIIPVENIFYRDIDNSFKYCSQIVFHCTFRQKLI